MKEKYLSQRIKLIFANSLLMASSGVSMVAKQLKGKVTIEIMPSVSYLSVMSLFLVRHYYRCSTVRECTAKRHVTWSSNNIPTIVAIGEHEHSDDNLGTFRLCHTICVLARAFTKFWLFKGKQIV